MSDRRSRLLPALLAGIAAALPAAAVSQKAPGTAIVRMDPGLDSLIAPDAVVEKLAGGFGFTEGPVFSSGRLRFSDLTRNRMYELVPGSPPRLLLDKSGGLPNPAPGSFTGSNGAVIDRDGTMLFCQHGARRIARMDRAGKVMPFIERYEGKRLNSPNDIVFAPDGALWITDPPFGLAKGDADPAKEQPFNAVYRYKDGKLKAVITDLPTPNGIAFSPDGRKLYVSNSQPDAYVNVYDVGPDGALSAPRKLISYPTPLQGAVPDGLKVDSRGNIWTTGPGGIRIISPDGKVLGQIRTPDSAQANVAFGGAGERDLFIMGASNVYRVHLRVAGETPLYSR